MNLGRFHAAIYSLVSEVINDKNFELLSELQSHLKNSISQNTPEAAQSFKQSYSSFLDTLENAESNNAFPTRKKIYEEIEAVPHFGAGLASRIKLVISENLVVPANALIEIQKIHDQSKAYFEKIKIIDTAFSELEIEYDDLDYGEFEIGFSFPKKVIGTDLESLEREFHKLDLTLKTFQEISTGEVSKINIKTISASDWQIFFESFPAFAACISVAIERIVALYKNNLEIKVLKQQLDEKKLPPKVTKPLQDHIEQTVKAELRKIADELVDEFYQNNDDGRRNELKNKTSLALSYIADKIDRGVTVEVHACLPKKPKPSEGENDKDIDPAALEEYNRIKEIVLKVNNTSKLTSKFDRSSDLVLSLKLEEKEDK